MYLNKPLILIVFYFICLISNAQAFREFEVGAQLGLNATTTSHVNSRSSQMLYSYNAGISGEYYFTDTWGLKLKVIYDKKGWKNAYVPNQNLNPEKVNIILNYITLPLMGNWHFGNTKEWYINFGFYTGFLLSVNDSESASAFDLKGLYNDVDFGGVLGFGYKFKIDKNIKLFLEIQGQSSTLNIYEDRDAGYFTTTTSSVNAGVLFHIR